MMHTLHLFAHQNGIEQAGALLRAGALVVMPTETVYGLAANALDPTAVARVYAAKGRPSDNPLIVHLADPEEVGLYAVPDERSRVLAKALWPGPLTIVLPGRGLFGARTLALHVPAHPSAHAIIAASARPIAAPSANRSTRPSPTSFADAVREMHGRVEAIVQGPRSDHGIESTVVSLLGADVALLRPGAISAQEISALLGGVSISRPKASLESPGTRYRHYAPDVQVTLFEGHGEDVREAVRVLLSEAPRSVYIGLVDSAPDGASGLVCESPRQLERGLYETLLLAEREGRPIVAVLPKASPGNEGIRDRLVRAAGGRVLQVGGSGEAR